MLKFFLELRRREVFRTAGLYIGVCWIAIEVADVLVPTFELPDWIMRALIIVAIVGFPVMLVLAWVYDVTDKGIEVQADATETVVIPFGDRKTDFVVIGVLAVALMISVYLNISNEDGVPVELEPVSLLIADFKNDTGNALFDGTLEQALALGVEGASFVTAYPRDRALDDVESRGDLGDTLDEEAARLVAIRQDVDLILAGSIATISKGFELEVAVKQAATGEEIARDSVKAKSAADVLSAINELAADIRKALGDDSLHRDMVQSGETVTASSLQAMKHYVTAQELASKGDDEEAIRYYKLALEEDPKLARAYSGWGLSAHKIGRADEAEEQWQKALSLLDRMTERERYRTFGLYYTVVSRNFDKAIENYQQLVEKFPADGAGNNNLAVLYTMTAQYERAFAQSEQLLEIYPGRVLYHANHAQYALYAGKLDIAREEAEFVIEKEDYFKSYMILAMVAVINDDILNGRLYYDRMAETGSRGQSLSNLGLADIDMLEGRFGEALLRLRPALELGLSEGYTRDADAKSVAIAQALAMQGELTEAFSVIDSVSESRSDSVLVPSAEFYAANGQYAKADDIASHYRTQFSPTSRAYAAFIDGMNAMHQEEYVIAIDAFNEALNAADLWIVRYYLAQAYLRGGYAAEAISEFDACIQRSGEASALFFDDIPTLRYTASLFDFRRQAQQALIAGNFSGRAVGE